MKIKTYSFVLGPVLIFAFLASFMASRTNASGQVKEDILKKIVPQDRLVKNDKSMGSLADRIIGDNEDLVKLFKGRNFKAMAELYARRGGVIVTQEYKKICGDEIAKFWADTWKEGAELQFKTVNIYLSDWIGVTPFFVVVEGKREEIKFDTVAVVVHEFRVLPKEKSAHNQRGGDCREYVHQTSCVWELKTK
jgi:hypothetical protein